LSDIEKGLLGMLLLSIPNFVVDLLSRKERISLGVYLMERWMMLGDIAHRNHM